MSEEPDGAAVGSRRARVALALVVLAALALAAAAAAPWLLRTVSPQLAVNVAYHEALSDTSRPRHLFRGGEPVECDPWGRPWRRHPRDDHPSVQHDLRIVRVYSVGPDGRDDLGRGDVLGDDLLPGGPSLVSVDFQLARHARLLASLVALTLAAWALAVGAPRQTGPREGLLVVAVSVPLSLLGTISLDAALADPTWRDRLPASDLALVAPADGLRATWALVVLLASTGLRFACRPLERPEDPLRLAGRPEGEPA